MWPWEHLAVGYLCYSLYCRLRTGTAPDGTGALSLAFGTQFPDLIDKPLAWQFGVLPSGNSFAHSVFTAGLLSVLAIVLTKRYGVEQAGIAFSIGYLIHLPGDVFYPLVYGKGPWITFLWWPLVPVDSGNTFGFLSKLHDLLARTAYFLTTPAGRVYLGAELLLLASAVGVWLLDGCPGIGVVRRRLLPRDH